MKQVKSIIALVLFTGLILLFEARNQNDTKKVHNEESNPDNVAGRVPGNSPATTEMGIDQMLEGETMVFKDTVSPEFKNCFNQVVNSYLAVADSFGQY